MLDSCTCSILYCGQTTVNNASRVGFEPHWKRYLPLVLPLAYDLIKLSTWWIRKSRYFQSVALFCRLSDHVETWRVNLPQNYSIHWTRNWMHRWTSLVIFCAYRILERVGKLWSFVLERDWPWRQDCQHCFYTVKRIHPNHAPRSLKCRQCLRTQSVRGF